MTANESGTRKKYLLELVNTAGIHGMQHLTNSRVHYFEKFVWFGLVVAAFIGTVYTSLVQYKRYEASPTVISLERDYRSWNGTLPAATLCYHDHLDSLKADKLIQDRWNVGIVDDEYFYFLEFIYSVVNATATNYADLTKFAQDERFDNIDLFEIALSIVRSVEQTIISYDPNTNVDIQPIMTERGMCYAFNSPMSEILKQRNIKSKPARKPLACQYGKQQCFLKLDIYENTGTLEIHSPYEVAGADPELITLQKSDEISASYKVIETVSSPTLRELSPSQRKCVFPDEHTANLPFYSKTLCLMKCRAVMAIEMCNCVPYFYPFVDGPSCTPAGFECLLDFKWPIWALHICKCPSTCTEQKYSMHAIKRRTWHVNADIPFHVKSSFRWDVLPPKVRIRRSVLFSFEDLLVSFGGSAALFLGFSFWSLLLGFQVSLKYVTVAIQRYFKKKISKIGIRKTSEVMIKTVNPVSTEQLQ